MLKNKIKYKRKISHHHLWPVLKRKNKVKYKLYKIYSKEKHILPFKNYLCFHLIIKIFYLFKYYKNIQIFKCKIKL